MADNLAQPLHRALTALEAALATVPMTDLTRDGTLHRFEFTFELAWKSIRRALVALGQDVQTASPRPLLRAALREGWIEDVTPWFTYLEARNTLSHTYDEAGAEAIFARVRGFVPLCRGLVAALARIDASDCP